MIELSSLFSTGARLVELGGPVVAILLGLSVAALALILAKAAQFLWLRVGKSGTSRRAADLWLRGDGTAAVELLRNNRSAVAAVLSGLMESGLNGRSDRDCLEDVANSIALSKLHELQRGFRALDAIAQTAPLLGLFGTVLGMIEAFRTLEAAGNSVDPSILAGGIWVALLTTAAGLAVAMPVSLILTWFESRLDDERVAIETLSSVVLSNVVAGPSAATPEVPPDIVPLSARIVHAH